MTAIIEAGIHRTPPAVSVVPAGPVLAGDAGDVGVADRAVRFGPIWMWSVALTTLILAVGVGVPMWALTGQIWDGVGLGVFTAVWGGPGFGTMVAGAIWTSRLERH